ncbi:MAG: hypothetical protein IT261_07870 [Saprospiraceae bacterium]|nr:hypothetical protein [Saprospiraceae bacterium]
MFKTLQRLVRNFTRLSRELEESKMLTARLLAQEHQKNAAEILKDLKKAEFRVFSQWNDDGIIQFLVQYLDIKLHTFVEFGVEDYKEANTRYLLQNNNWTGLVLDGSAKNVQKIREDRIYWQHELTAREAFVTAENINELLSASGMTGEIGLLHIDIDGNDYWVWKAIQVADPVLVIMEYNSVFGPENAWTVPYDPSFYRTDYHHSNLCYGASLTALCDLANEKGYAFVGSNSHGNNAYFVRKDKLRDLRVLQPSEGFVVSKFREGRDRAGKLTYWSGEERLEAIRGCRVWDTRLNKEVII